MLSLFRDLHLIFQIKKIYAKYMQNLYHGLGLNMMILGSREGWGVILLLSHSKVMFVLPKISNINFFYGGLNLKKLYGKLI